MRLIKVFGVAAMAALALSAITWASTASATGITALCNANESPCSEGNQLKELHMTLTPSTVGVLHGLSPLFPVVCLNVLALGEVLAPENPQQVHLLKLDFTNCGTNAEHSNCTIKSLELPVLLDVLKTGAGVGTETGLNGETLVTCKIPLIGEIDCIYEGKGLSFEVKSAEAGNHGMLNAANTPVKKTSGSGFCSEQSTITSGLLEPLTDVYISGGSAGPHTALCSSHSGVVCPEKDQVKSLELKAAKPPVLLNSVANVECDGLTGKAAVGGLGEPQDVEVNELAWTECHTQGAADNCTVSNEGLPTLAVSRTSLNVGTASTTEGAVELKCEVLGLFEMDCVYPWPSTLEVEGALQTEAAGNGTFSADKAVVELVEGNEHCPETAKWDLSLESTSEVYVLE